MRNPPAAAAVRERRRRLHSAGSGGVELAAPNGAGGDESGGRQRDRAGARPEGAGGGGGGGGWALRGALGRRVRRGWDDEHAAEVTGVLDVAAGVGDGAGGHGGVAVLGLVGSAGDVEAAGELVGRNAVCHRSVRRRRRWRRYPARLVSPRLARVVESTPLFATGAVFVPKLGPSFSFIDAFALAMSVA